MACAGESDVEGGLDEPLSGLSPKSISLTLPSLLEALKSGGYHNIDVFGDIAKPERSGRQFSCQPELTCLEVALSDRARAAPEFQPRLR